MDKKLTEKIKELLTPEDLQLFESGLEKYAKSESLKAVEIMKEEVKLEYDQLSKKFCDKKITEAKAEFDKKLIEEKANIIEQYDGKLNQLEQKVVGRLNTFIEHVVKDKISDEKIEVIAENAIMLPIVEKMKKVFAESYVSIDTDGSTKIKELQKTIKKFETQLTEAIASKIESEEKLDKTATYLFISEKTQGLTESDKSRVVKMFKDKKFSETKEKIDSFVEIIKENRELPTKSVDKSQIDEIISEDDGIKDSGTVLTESDDSSDIMKSAMKFLDQD